eukprot:TRINITY_DN31393_c0_g1_i1.p1 TRINITY_DN31393_c0_g1~~TRINITY_DN31393_c0_g1_i1.p1  ORF type:complete len:754 (+),score=209.96 TRINITY_DN31393_c0_g1_i1:78-2339(+)
MMVAAPRRRAADFHSGGRRGACFLSVVAAAVVSWSLLALRVETFTDGLARRKSPHLYARALQKRGPFTVRCAAAADTVLLQGTDLYGTHDELRTLFRIPKLTITRGQKLAIVGANGCGKSTLLKALAGKEKLHGGKLEVTPGKRVVMVDQSSKFDKNMKVVDAVFHHATSVRAQAWREYRDALASGDNDLLEGALEKMEQSQAWGWEENANQVMAELGLTQELQQRQVGKLSGGEERRVALAAALVDLDATDLLILDEPTNHLSTEGCDWLEDLLRQKQDLAVALVTHDRYFLDSTCDQIMEMDGFGETFMHPGSWQQFLTRRAERYTERQAQVDTAKTQLKRAEAWMARGVRGRGSRNQAQVNAYQETKKKAGEALSTVDDSAPNMLAQAKASKSAGRSRGAKVNVGLLQLKNATMELPGRGCVFRAFDVDFAKGQKVGIVGPNGVGKTTFLKSISGDMPLTSGERVEGEEVNIGFLTQDATQFPNPRQRVIELVQEIAAAKAGPSTDGEAEKNAGSWQKQTAKLLKSVNFPQEKWHTEVQMLSGGERRRLQLLRVLSQDPNILLLDEPTNDLDAVTVDALERLLQDWAGTLIIVSHDRSLLDGVCNRYLVFSRNTDQPRVWTGTHAELMDYEKEMKRRKNAQLESEMEAAVEEKTKKAKAAAPAQKAASSVSAPAPSPKTYKSQKEQRQAERKLKQVESKIEQVETELAELEEEMERECSNANKVMELDGKRQELELVQAELYEEWETLSA